MRRVPTLVWRATVGLSIFAAGWLPAAAVAFWGGAYFLRCLHALTAPGVPVEYRYETEGGEVVVRAKGYQIVPETREGYFNGVSVTDAAGNTVATCNFADFSYQGGVFTVRFINPEIHVRRLSDGSFDVMRLLPKKIEEKAGEEAFRIVLKDAQVNYTDEKVEGAPIVANVTNFLIESSGGVYAFNSDLKVGTFSASVFGTVTEADGTKASVRTKGADLAPLIPYINAFLDPEVLGEFAALGARRAVASGEATLILKQEAPARVFGDLLIECEGLRSGQTFKEATLVSQMRSDGSNVSLNATVKQHGLDAKFVGVLALANKFRVRGRLDATIMDRESLPPQVAPFVSSSVAFQDARYVGGVDSDIDTFVFDGDLTARSVSYEGEEVRDFAAYCRLDQDGFASEVATAKWAGIEATGTVSVDFATGEIAGGLQSRNGDIGPLAEHFGTTALSGQVSASVVLGGKVDDVRADLYARGSGRIKVGEGPPAHFGVFELRGGLDPREARLDRLEVNGPNGLLVASGAMGWQSGQLDFSGKGGGIDLSSLVPDTKGLAFFDFAVKGTKSRPLASARAEVYGAEIFGRQIPQAVADVSADQTTVNVHRFALRAGSGQMTGSAKLDLNTKSLSGEFAGEGLRLEEWFNQDTVGSADVKEGKISGTLESPTATGTVSVHQFFAAGVDVKDGLVPFVVNKEAARSDGFTFKVEDGTLDGSASYAFADGSASLKGSFKDLPLQHAAYETENLSLSGFVSGNFDAERAGGNWQARLSSDLSDVAVNKTTVGQGWLESVFKDGALSLDAQVGSIDRYVLLEHGRYDTVNRNLEGNLLVYNVLLEDVLAASQKPMAGLPDKFKDVALNTRGLINAEVGASGSVDDPVLSIKSAALSGLQLRSRPAGSLRIVASRNEGEWQVPSVLWQHEDTRFAASGSFTEDGRYDASGDLNNFDASWIHSWLPDAPLLTGKIDLSFKSTGTYDDPIGSASIVAQDLGYYEGATAVKFPLSVQLDEVAVQDRSVSLKGQVFYQGLSAQVSGLLPFAQLYGGQDDRQIEITATAPERSLADLAQFFPLMDPGRTAGKVWGTASLRGGWDGLALYADIDSAGTAFALKGNGTQIKDYVLSLDVKEESAKFSAAFAGGTAGRGFIDATADLPARLVSSETSVQDLMASTVVGSVVLDGLDVRATLPTAERPSRALVSTKDLKVTGTLGAPILNGEVLLKDVYVRLPSEIIESQAPTVYPIDPTFEGVAVTVAPGSVLDSGNAQIEFQGKGRLGGSLQNPDVSLPLKVSGGTFRLPTARIELEDNGEITVGYRASLGSAPTARVDLSLVGNTTVSARRLDNQYETYPVQLEIKGNLLEDNGLTIFAVSDPPDLTSDQIMAILGRKELIENFARSGSDSDVRESLYSAALPAAANMVTSGLASGLGLDYIALDYNPSDQAIAGFGKSVAKGLMFHATRQLSSSAGERLKYEVQLTYRLPLKDRVFSRIRLGLGADQDVPWRLRLNWARRI